MKTKWITEHFRQAQLLLFTASVARYL